MGVQDKYINSFLGFGPEDEGYFSVELTKNYGVESYDLGNQFGHFGLAVPDVYATVDKIKKQGLFILSCSDHLSIVKTEAETAGRCEKHCSLQH